MRKLLFSSLLVVVFLFSCTSETDYCRAFCQKAGECANCGGVVDIDGCIDDCKNLDDETQEKLVDCYKGECENYFMCADIIGQNPPSPCK
ncbi:hypothetical protein KKF34_01305 [Myxococcota bacterium]|nr:hypothetical protein [Myxococcota bacterium]MBU1380039.1 hypothetical protein [Myxococcota bacterium]MBU1495497.1 hypothetical protein [Myxococcota bacterium]